MTANNDAAFFGVHTDAGYGANDLRHLTYVYYFNGEPKGFEGGELRVYTTCCATGASREARRSSVEPLHNSVVFFWARAMHEVRPVRVASKAFRDSLFTVNGWVNKA